jgi:hippurate hydrolase
MIEDGLFEKYTIDAVFGLHNHPTEKFGRFMIKKGPVMASIDTWTVTVRGRSGHSSQPHKSVNPIVVASHIVLAIKSISSLDIDPSSSHVITVTKIDGGTTFNIIPDTCTIHGSVRCFDESVNTSMRGGEYGYEDTSGHR